jgi:hypothetical protein
MAAQINNIMLLDLSDGVPRTIDTTNDVIEIGAPVELTTLATTGDASIGGDLTVAGDIVSRGQVDVVIQDSFLDLGFGNSTVTAAAGGFTVSMNRNSGFTASTVTAFTANSGSGASFTNTDATGSTLLAAGDVVAITLAGDGENDGIYIVDSVSGAAFPQTVVVKGLGTAGAISADCPWAQNAFKTATGQTASAYKIDLAVVAIADGVAFDTAAGSPWPKGTFVTAYEANATMADFEVHGAYASVGEVDLQEAYATGNVITTSAANGIVSIAGDQSLTVSASGGIIAGGAGLQVTGSLLNVDTAVDVDLTGAFAVDGNQAVTFGASSQVASLAIDTVGAFSVLADAASSVRVDGASLTMKTATSGSIIADSAGDFDVLAGIMDVDLTGALEIDAAAASNITVDGANLTVATTTSGSMILDAVALMDMNAGAGMDIDVTGAFDMLSSGVFSIDGTGASNVSATSGNLTLSSVTSGNVVVASAADVDIDGANITADATAGISLDASATSNFTVAGADLDLSTTGSGMVNIQAAGNVDVDGVSVLVNGTAASHFEVASANLVLGTTTAGELHLKAAGLLNIDAGANADIDVSGNVDLDATGTLSMDAVGNSNLTIDSGNLTMQTTTAGNMVANSFGTLDIDSGAAMTLDSVAGISIDGGNASNFSTAAGALTLNGAAGVNIAGNAAEIDVTTSGVLDLNSGTGTWDAAGTLDLTATGDITVGLTGNTGGGTEVLLEIRSENAGAGKGELVIRADDGINIGDDADPCLIQLNNFTGLTGGAGFHAQHATAGDDLTAGDACVMKWDSVNSEQRWYKAEADAASDQDRFCHGVAEFTANAGSPVNINAVMGTEATTALTGLAGTNTGDPVYVSTTAGGMTLSAPTASGHSVIRVGFIKEFDGGPGSEATIIFAPQFIAKRP